jgi:peptide/nickel transport system permease protein
VTSLGTFLLRRLAVSAVVLWGVSLLTFSLVYVVPGNPALAIAGDRAPQALLEQIRRDLGLQDPLLVQYARYLSRLVRGDLGDSYVFRTPVGPAIAERLPVTFRLALVAIVFRVLAGAAVGLASALNRGGPIDRALMGVALVGLSSPHFWLGLMLLYVFAYKLDWLPLGGHESWQHTVLPALTLTFSGAAWYGRVFRSSLLDVLNSDYVRTARAKGLAPSAVVARHVARNALGPLLTMTGTDLGHFLGGVVVVETVFGWPGVGKLAWDAVRNLDGPLIMGTVLVGAVFVVVANLVVDIVYRLLDPRVTLA